MAASHDKRADVDELVDSVLAGDEVGAAEPTQVGQELFAAARTIDSQASLRRFFSDASVAAEAKSALIDSLFGSRFSAATVSITQKAVGIRWSYTRELADVIERAGVMAHAAAADREGQLDDLEDELFRFGRIIEAQPALRDLLNDRATPVEAKHDLLRELLGHRTTSATQALVAQAAYLRYRTVGVALESFQRVAAARRDRMLATVRVAAELTGDQRDRLAGALQRSYGREVHLNVIVDPSVLGGVRVSIGDEIIDSTVSTRLAQARRRLAG